MTPRLFIIGGTSHVGKSTLGAAVASRMGWRWVSTDSLARHPGRPWRDAPEQVPPHVIEYYRDLSLDERMQSVLQHYRSMWEPLVLPLMTGDEPLVLEGSALLPELVVTVLSQETRAVWLVADEGVVERRIRIESAYDSRDAQGRLLIDSFAERAGAFNHLIAEEVERFGLQKIEVGETTELDELLEKVVTGNG